MLDNGFLPVGETGESELLIDLGSMVGADGKLFGPLANPRDEFVGLAFGERILDREGREVLIGSTPPFNFLIALLFTRQTSGPLGFAYEAWPIDLPQRAQVLLLDQGLASSLTQATAEPGTYQLEFQDSGPDFGFALFPYKSLLTLVSFPGEEIFLSGASISFGSGYRTRYRDSFFSLKLEVGTRPLFGPEEFRTEAEPEPVNNTDTGAPDFVIATPCPPRWEFQ